MFSCGHDVPSMFSGGHNIPVCSPMIMMTIDKGFYSTEQISAKDGIAPGGWGWVWDEAPVLGCGCFYAPPPHHVNVYIFMVSDNSLSSVYHERMGKVA